MRRWDDARAAPTLLGKRAALWMLMSITPSTGAGDPVEGTIGERAPETWTKAGSPYVVVGDVQVVDLRIEPGVQVVFEGDHEFRVTGTLVARGEPSDVITFTSVDPPEVTWKGIEFNAAAGSELVWCVVEWANSGGLRLTNSPGHSIEHCTFRHNTSGDRGGGVRVELTHGEQVFRGCSVTENSVVVLGPGSASGGGVYARTTGGGRIRLDGCLIVGNEVLGQFRTFDNVPTQSLGAGVYAAGDVELVSCVIARNTSLTESLTGFGAAQKCRGAGVHVAGDASSVHLRNSVVRYNTAEADGRWSGVTITAQGAGIFLDGGALVLENTVMASNTALAGVLTPGPGAGLYASASSSARVENCTVAWNNLEALHNAGAQLAVENSILFFNNGLHGSQISGPGATTVEYSCVQGFPAEDPETGNIGLNPAFACDADLRLARGSPCVDAGNPTPALDDCSASECAGLQCPSLGNSRNDMGACGGPGACLREDIADCNRNCIDDQEDIAARTSHDCDGNGWPDECDIARVPEADGDGDGLLDRCERRSLRLELRSTRPVLTYAALLESDTPFLGGEACLRLDPEILEVRALRPGVAFPHYEQEPADPAAPGALLNCGDGLAGFCLAWLNGTLDPPVPPALKPPGVYELFEVDLAYTEGARGPSRLTFAACLEDTTVLTVDGEISVPLSSFDALVASRSFVRGDANDDSRFDLSDAIGILLWRFAGRELGCLDAADTDDSGQVDIMDAIDLLQWRFRLNAMAAPRPPYPECGPDPTSGDDLPDCTFRNCR